ncbi:MAG TPA: CAP domain-containing protein [Thermoleophilaceae bacterium]|jgi:uncharacterized protein YkwD|nr:CAP domain-containing protein [Thermoleophilaceae bacterium]
MTTLRRAACLALVCLAVAPAAAGANPTQSTLIAHVNYARGAYGLAPLAISPSLNRSASAFAGGLMRLNIFGHASSIQAGGGFRTLGEVLRLHSGTRPRYSATVRAWLASPPHRAVVLSSAFTHAGAGIARGVFQGRNSTIWVMHVGAY